MMILDRISVDPDAIPTFKADWQPDLLGGVVTIRGEGQAIVAEDWGETLYRGGPAPAKSPIAIVAVPYCVWDNRDPGEMRVWLRAC
jgi:DUF1680 family protein